MRSSSEERRKRYLAKAQAELEGLHVRGVVMAGNAFSQALLLKGDPTPAERVGAALFEGPDGVALRAALQALGYEPQDWAGLAAWDAQGAPLVPGLLREALCVLDPSTLIVCDDPAAQLVREAYAEDLSSLERFDEAMLAEGLVVMVAGMRVLALGGFAAALASPADKQLMWRRLKQLPPLGEPY